MTNPTTERHNPATGFSQVIVAGRTWQAKGSIEEVREAVVKMLEERDG